jgi:cyclopropane fatty-acyl-phospholipid synthase-like methyltransferase
MNPNPNPNPNQALWEKGDFTRIAATMRDSGEALVRSLGITPGLKVLDLGCGDGMTALPEAQLGAKRRSCGSAPRTRRRHRPASSAP